VIEGSAEAEAGAGDHQIPNGPRTLGHFQEVRLLKLPQLAASFTTLPLPTIRSDHGRAGGQGHRAG